MTDAIDFDRADAGAIRFGWWKTHEHFCAPGSHPEAISRVSGSEPGAISRSGDLVLGDLRTHTEDEDYRRNPVIAVDFGGGWRYAYKAPDKDTLVDSRIRHPTQPRKYERVRNEETTNRSNLREVPPREELDIVPRDLDTSEQFASEAVAEETELEVAIALGDEIERRYAERVVRQRQHQPELRRMTLDHHGTACTYCGLDVPQIVEAAHLVADSEGGEASIQNTRPMCPNHHRAFDAGLLVWDGERFERADGAPPVGPAPRWA